MDIKQMTDFELLLSTIEYAIKANHPAIKTLEGFLENYKIFNRSVLTKKQRMSTLEIRCESQFSLIQQTENLCKQLN